MVVGAFPAAKLGVLALKQISKPIANIIKNRAKKSQIFSKYICMPPAQFYNWMEVKTKMWAMNLGKPTNVPQLNEAMAIELGANLLGEVIIFTIGAGVLIFEYIRQANKEVKKEETLIQEKRDLAIALSELAFRIEKQNAQMREMSRIVADLESRQWLPKKLRITSSSDPPKDNEKSNSSKQTASRDDTIANKISGNYNPSDGILFKALNMIENELFYRETSSSRANQIPVGVVTKALVYLKYLG